jgi:putative transposase
MMCKILQVSKSKYYNWLKNHLGKHEQRMKELDLMIKTIFIEHKERYGSTRIYYELKSLNISCTRATIAKRMQKMDLVAKAKRKFKVTTDSNHGLAISENIINQDFTTTSANQKWLSDISYIPTKEGWLYLCVFIDLYSRSVIGWSMQDNLKSTLVTNAITMSLFRRKFPKNVIVHSDRGSQYCSKKYQSLLENNNLVSSMSGKGCCYDNAPAESFFHTLKVELVHEAKYKSRQEAKTSIANYIECYYNKKRRHSAINYNIPEEYEKLKNVV